jgi:hypothetical protein
MYRITQQMADCVVEYLDEGVQRTEECIRYCLAAASEQLATMLGSDSQVQPWLSWLSKDILLTKAARRRPSLDQAHRRPGCTSHYAKIRPHESISSRGGI